MKRSITVTIGVLIAFFVFSFTPSEKSNVENANSTNLPDLADLRVFPRFELSASHGAKNGLSFDSTKPKEYQVLLTIQKWDGFYRGIGDVISELKRSDLPSKNVVFLTDSVLFPLQQQILMQIRQQLKAEEDAAKKKPNAGN